MDIVNEYLLDPTNTLLHGSYPIRRKVTCEDGFSISVQANRSAYSIPRDNSGPWSTVECGYPSAIPGEALLEYAEDKDNPLDTVYGYVPITVVVAELESHGGIKND